MSEVPHRTPVSLQPWIPGVPAPDWCPVPPPAAQAGHKPKAAAEGEAQVSGGGKSLHMTD